jgi:excisionase family DNA binding protein
LNGHGRDSVEGDADVCNASSLRSRVVKPSPPHPLPILLTVDETAALLRTSRRAIYAMVERNHLPGVARIGRRVLVRSGDLLDWLDRKSALSLKE